MGRNQPLNPPFRAEHIGSLLRPAALVEARQRHLAGELADEELRAIEDEAIDAAVALQDELGLRSVTDGEYRRVVYFTHFFTAGLGGIDYVDQGGEGWSYTNAQGGQLGASLPKVNHRLRWTKPIHADDFAFVKARTSGLPKITLPGPCVLHFFGGRANISAEVYPHLDLFWDDLVQAYRSELTALAAAGCTYVQFDETAFAKFGDAKIQRVLAQRGDDWQALIDLYIEVMNRIVAACPARLRLGMHMCRGNKRGHWQAEGGYEVVAERLFNRLNITTFFLEYDTPRAGDFTPLRFFPKGKTAVLGLVSTKSPVLESADDLKRRIDEAARYVDLDQLALSPQCGFASDFRGNKITPDDQRAKLARVVEVAADVWG